MLAVEKLSAAYGEVPVLHNISLNIQKGQIVTLIGANGAGKTTLMRTISGLHKPTAGCVSLKGEAITGLKAHQIVKKGLSMVPEGRKLFNDLNVLDNLTLGTFGQKVKLSKGDLNAKITEVLDTFPRLKERLHQTAGTLSGGEQQMLAIARGLMSGPEVLLMDEPSLGLAPLLVEEIFRLVRDLNSKGVTIFLVEQNAFMALEISDWGYVLENGSLVKEAKAADLLKDDQIHHYYLGGKSA